MVLYVHLPVHLEKPLIKKNLPKLVSSNLEHIVIISNCKDAVTLPDHLVTLSSIVSSDSLGKGKRPGEIVVQQQINVIKNSTSYDSFKANYTKIK